MKTAGVVVVLLATLAVTVDAQEGKNLPPGLKAEQVKQKDTSRDRAEALATFQVAQIWAELTLTMALDQAKVETLRPILAQAWEQRKQVVREAAEDGNWAYAKTEMKKRQRALQAQLQKLLTSAELKQLRNAVRVN